MAKKTLNPYYLTNRVLKIGLKIILDSHHINFLNSILTNIPNYKEIDKVYINKILKEMATIYAKLLNENTFVNHTLLSANFYKLNEEDQRGNEFE